MAGKPSNTELTLVPAEPGFLKDMLESQHLRAFLRTAAQQTLTHQARMGAPAPWTGCWTRCWAAR